MKFTVHDEQGKVIGIVWAANGNDAWHVTRTVNPLADHLKPA